MCVSGCVSVKRIRFLLDLFCVFLSMYRSLVVFCAPTWRVYILSERGSLTSCCHFWQVTKEKKCSAFHGNRIAKELRSCGHLRGKERGLSGIEGTVSFLHWWHVVLGLWWIDWLVVGSFLVIDGRRWRCFSWKRVYKTCWWYCAHHVMGIMCTQRRYIDFKPFCSNQIHENKKNDKLKQLNLFFVIKT